MYQPENKKVSISVIFVYFVRPPLLGCRPDPPGLLARTSPGSKLPGPTRLRAIHAGVPPVSIHVIVRSAHSALARKFF